MSARDTSLRLARSIDTLCEELLPAGNRRGQEFRVGSVSNEPGNSLRIHLRGAETGKWCDFATGDFGDPLDLVKRVLKLDTADAIRWSLSFLGFENSGEQPHKIVRNVSRWSQKAESIWRQCQEITGTVGAAYYARRGCFIPQSNEVRFLASAHHWPTRTRWPALVARITDALTSAPLSLHFTYLDPDSCSKAPLDTPKLLLPKHAKQGGVIRLVEDADVTTGLGITEGCETALSVMAAGWTPVWAVIDTGNMATFSVLAGIQCLTVFADNDSAGLKAANRVADRWLAAGREVRICRPRQQNADWNDILCVRNHVEFT